MQRILATTGRRSKLGFTIELDEPKYYYGGDTVKGHIVLESPKSIKINRIRMQWLGVVRVQLDPTTQDEVELFRETCNVDLPAASVEDDTDSAAAAARRSALMNAAAATTAYGMMLPPSAPSVTFSVEADTPYRFPFAFTVPDQDPPLPSCTESETSTDGIVEYTIEAQVERPSTDFAAPVKTRINVPVLQRIDITLDDELTTPQSSHVSCAAASDERNTATLTATVPKKAFLRSKYTHQSVPVTVHIQHFEAFSRPNAVIIALIRVARILCKEVSYLLSDSVVHYVKADLGVTQTGGFTQTIVRSILIPGTITPTIETHGQQLLEVGYKVRVRAQMQESSYELPVVNFPSDFQSLVGMTVEMPITVGTLPELPARSPTSPISPRFVNPFEQSDALLQAPDECDDVESEASPRGGVGMLKKILRRTSSSGSAQTLPVENSSRASLSDTQRRRASNVSLSIRGPFKPSSNDKQAALHDSSNDLISDNSTDSAATATTTSPASSSFLSPSSAAPKIQDAYRLSVGPSLSSWFDQSYLSGTSSPPTTTPPPPLPAPPAPALLTAQLSIAQGTSPSARDQVLEQPPRITQTKRQTPPPLVDTQTAEVTLTAPPLLKSKDPARRRQEDQERQRADHLEQSQLDQRHFDGNTYYFYPFGDSESEREGDDNEHIPTPAGLGKPNSMTSNLGAGEARVTVATPTRQPLHVSRIIDKPDELTDSDLSDDDDDDEEDDLLDIISKRDRRIASRITNNASR